MIYFTFMVMVVVKKQISIYILLIAFVMQTFSQVTIYASFFLQQDYIAEFLCINKDVESSTCNGNCQLKKELAKESSQDENQKIPIQIEEYIHFCSCEKLVFTPSDSKIY